MKRPLLGRQLRLWEGDVPRLDGWFPGETLFSLASRFHRVSGEVASGPTGQRLFGHRAQGCSHDFPSRVRIFAKRTEGVFGKAEAIIRGHTILPYYFPFRSTADRRLAMAAACGNTGARAKARFGLLFSGFGAQHPLRTCRRCRQGDQDRFGVAYWHLPHQLPGAIGCPDHHEILEVTSYRASSAGRFQWCLPDRVPLRPLTEDPPCGLFDRMTDSAFALWGLPAGVHFEPDRLRHTYLRRLAQLGFIAGNRSLRQQALAERILEVTAVLRRVGGLEHLPGTATDARRQFLRLFYSRTVTTHPLRHLVLILALFEDWEAFRVAYRQAPGGLASYSKPNATKSRSPVRVPETATRRGAFIAAVQAGQSAATAAAAQGISTTTGVVWARAAGLNPSRRPKVMNDALQRRAARLLAQGRSKAEVARTCGISVSSVARLLLSNPGLRARWEERAFRRRRDADRQLWLQASRKVPTDSLKRLRKQQPAVFAWLYRNDRSWLRQFNQSLPRGRS